MRIAAMCSAMFLLITVGGSGGESGEIFNENNTLSFVKSDDQVRFVPKILNYQGYLTDTLGNPINDSLDMIFRIYGTASGGTAIWIETQIEVPVLKGIFNVLLGSVTPVPDSVFTRSTNRWLELRVGGQTLAPRTQITSAGYAYMATYSDTAEYARSAPGGADNDWIIVGNDMYSGVSGNVGIGTATPQRPLQVIRSVSMFGYAVGHFENTETMFDGVGVYGACSNADGNGWGGWFKGGEIGVRGTVQPTGSSEYHGVEGICDGNSGSGSNYGIYGRSEGSNSARGVYGYAHGTGINYGIYGIAENGTTNWGGYFDGNVYISDSLGVDVLDPRYPLDVNGVICGGWVDTVNGYGGGILAGYSNLAGDAFDDTASVVTGGYNNSVTGKYSFIGGGLNNAVTYRYAAIVGGYADTASGQYSFIGGGQSNIASLDNAVVAGGYNNTASGGTSTICGGMNNVSSNAASFVGGGSENVASESRTVVSGGWGNTASGWCSTIGGGYNNAALEYASVVAGGREDTARAVYGAVLSGRYNLAGDAFDDTASVVTGGYNNSVTGKYSFIGGGFNNAVTYRYAAIVGGYADTATGQYSFIGGGQSNIASSDNAVVAGGSNNTASGGTSTVCGGSGNVSSMAFSFIGAGYGNTASGNRSVVGGGDGNTAGGYCATIGGGDLNIASGNRSAVGGGQGDSAVGDFAVVAGGRSNKASGIYSYAAGRRAKALHAGSFVWTDSMNADWGSTGVNQFIIRANGGVGINTSSPGYPLDVAGACHASSFPTSSDQRLKKNVEQLSGVLAKLMKVRGVKFDWNEKYEAMGRSTGHKEIGVVAQEIEAQFPELVSHWGNEDYCAVDYGRLTAVLIEAIKELKTENDELKTRMEKLEQE